MAAYRAVIQGHRSEASRLGTKASGIRAAVNTWKTQVRVEYYGDPDNPQVGVWAEEYGNRGVRRVLYDGPESGLLNGEG